MPLYLSGLCSFFEIHISDLRSKQFHMFQHEFLQINMNNYAMFCMCYLWIDMIIFFRDSSIRKNVLRIFTIWEERKIYDGEFISDLKGALGEYCCNM